MNKELRTGQLSLGSLSFPKVSSEELKNAPSSFGDVVAANCTTNILYKSTQISSDANLL